MNYEVVIQLDGNFTTRKQEEAADAQTAVKQALHKVVDEWEVDTHDNTVTIEVLRVGYISKTQII